MAHFVNSTLVPVEEELVEEEELTTWHEWFDAEPLCVVNITIPVHAAQWVLHLICCGTCDLYCTRHKQMLIAAVGNYMVLCKHCGQAYATLEEVARWEKL